MLLLLTNRLVIATGQTWSSGTRLSIFALGGHRHDLLPQAGDLSIRGMYSRCTVLLHEATVHSR